MTAINLHSSYNNSSCFDSPVIDLTVIAAHNITMLRPVSFAFQLPSYPAFSLALLSPTPSPPCCGDLPCLLTDNSDRKLLHVITLLKSQFTQPQQIILRWVPRVMETVFFTLHPASPVPPKPRRSLQRRATSSSPTFSPTLPPVFTLSFFLSFTLGLYSGFQTGELQRLSSGWHCLLLNWTLYR